MFLSENAPASNDKLTMAHSPQFRDAYEAIEESDISPK